MGISNKTIECEDPKLVLTSYIIDDYCNRRIPDVAWNETPKSLLSCSIPVNLL